LGKDKLPLNIILLIISVGLEVILFRSELIVRNGECFGMIEGMRNLALIFIELIVCIIGIVQNRKSRFFLVYLGVFLMVVFTPVISDNINNWLNRNAIVYSSDGSSNATLYLKPDSTFELVKGQVDFACYYKGQYTIRKDTLYLGARKARGVDFYSLHNGYLTDLGDTSKEKRVLYLQKRK
jgi:hypothetical protein